MAGKSQHQLVEHPEKPGDRGFKWNRDLVLCLMGKQEHILVERPESATSRVYKEPPGKKDKSHRDAWLLTDCSHHPLGYDISWA